MKKKNMNNMNYNNMNNNNMDNMNNSSSSNNTNIIIITMLMAAFILMVFPNEFKAPQGSKQGESAANLCTLFTLWR